jgi:hypothetical protein
MEEVVFMDENRMSGAKPTTNVLKRGPFFSDERELRKRALG